MRTCREFRNFSSQKFPFTPEWTPAGVCFFARARTGTKVGILNENRSRSDIFQFLWDGDNNFQQI